MKLISMRRSEVNEAAMTPWTVVHFGNGLALGLVGSRFTTALLAAVAFEFFEHYFEGTETGRAFFKTSGPETIPNAFVDVAVVLGGWYLGNRWLKT